MVLRNEVICMNEAMKKALWEAFKEAMRLAFSVGVGFFLDWGVAYFTNTPPSGQTMTMLAFGFRMADYFWHQYNKDRFEKSEGKSMGIIPW